MMTSQQERIGISAALGNAVIWGLFPVLVHYGAQSIPPITFAAYSALLAAAGAFVYAAFRKELPKLKYKPAWNSLLFVALFIVIIPYTLFFIGASHTSGVNTSMLLLTEIIFMMIFTPFFGEPTSKLKILGACGVLFGAAFILYNGSFSINIGDVLIIVSTFTFIFGNFYAKRALTIVPPSIVLFVRYLFGGIFILGLSFIIEPDANQLSIVKENWLILLATGIGIWTVGKLIWYEALRRLDISKAISLGMTFPVFSLFYLIVFFNETVSLYQWIGIGIMGIGVWFALQRKSVPIGNTRYGKH